jgi:hypothetical protein
VFLLPPLALKLWLFYYRLEGAKREGWATRDTIVAKCAMDKDSITKWRTWLVANGWMRQIGEHKISGRFFGVPVMQITRGTIPAVLSKHGTSAASKATRFQRRENPVTVSDGKTQSHTVTGTAGRPVTGKPSSIVAGFSRVDVDVSTEVDKPYVDGPVRVGSDLLIESGQSPVDSAKNPAPPASVIEGLKPGWKVRRMS